ncbi:MAG: hypothetical protein AB8H79_07035 [Myxococcota bacterium]
MRIISLLILAACAGGTDTPGETDKTDDTEVSGWTAPEAGVISLTTRDSVVLEADYLPAATEGASAVILLHMIPPNATRADWPAAFRTDLADNGWSVIAVDRRGAGGSGGVASEAYTGEKGRYDVEACAKKLSEDGYGKIAIIGASNGTTSMIDYAAWAASESLPEPVGLGFMSGGGYTESQTAMSAVPQIPMVFQYPPSEATWPDAQKALDPGTWQFKSYDNGAHGTRLFTTTHDAEVRTDLVDFLKGVL